MSALKTVGSALALGSAMALGCAHAPPARPPPPPCALEISLLEPAAAGASVGALVSLQAPGLAAATRVLVGEAEAPIVARKGVDGLRAQFPAVPLTRRGKVDVTALFEDGRCARAERGFEYLFDEDPVVFVHGYLGADWNWKIMRRHFVEAGYPPDQLFVIDFADSTGSSLSNARQLAAFVAQVRQRTGAERVDVVARDTALPPG